MTIFRKTSQTADLVRHLFDDDYYRLNYEDVSQSGFDRLAHFMQYGWREGRNPSPDFVTLYYRDKHLNGSAINPLDHYIAKGKSLHLTTKPEDADYIDLQQDLSRPYFSEIFFRLRTGYSGEEALRYYLRQAWRDDAPPCFGFEAQRYLKDNRYVEALGISPLYHFASQQRLRGKARQGAARSIARRDPSPSGYKVVAATRLLDEADIVEAFVRHTAFYADAHVFLDNGSTDGTLEILESLRDEGFTISVFQNKSAIFRENQFNTFLYREAHKLGSSWTIFLDADEFVDDRALEGGFTENLKAIHDDASVSAFLVVMTDYCLTERDWAGELNIVKRMGHRRETGVNKKIVVRGGLGAAVAIDIGSHGVLIDGEQQLDLPTLHGATYAHYPERSAYQFLTKNVRGRLKVLASAASLRTRDVNHHYKVPFEVLRDQPDLFFSNPAFMQQHHDWKSLQQDPIEYKGGELRYTVEDYNTEAMRAVRTLTQFIQQLACQHGALLDNSKEARKLVERWSSQITRVL